MGDFNECFYPHEHSAANPLPYRRGMREFKQCVDRCSLSDLPYCGNTFNWTNKQGSGYVAKKIDRILVNDLWLATFRESIGVFGEPGISDHSPCCIFIDAQKPKQKTLFKFFSLLNHHPEFAEVLRSCWNSLNFSGSKMLCISKKLKEIKSVIRSFSRENYSDLEKRVSEFFLISWIAKNAYFLHPLILLLKRKRKPI